MPAKTGTPAPAGFMWIEDAAKALGIQVCTLYKWRQRRTGPASARHAGRLIYSETGIRSYLEGLMASDSHANPELNPVLRVPRPHIRSRAAA